jgi:hypothetical protein
MSRLQYLRHKHETPLENILALVKEEKPQQCKNCKKLYTPECSFLEDFRKGILTPEDHACADFERKESRASRENRKKKRKEKYELALYETVPPTLKPCGFYPETETLTESTWLPYRDTKGNITLRPSVIIAKPTEEPQIIDFLSQETIKGTFPSKDLQSLMSVEGVRMLIENQTVEPRQIDKEIDKAFQKHLSMPEPERILAKRWAEGTFFYDVFDAFPIQSVLGVSESGKSRLCLLNLALCYHAEGLIDPTEATIFRAKEEDRVTLVIDEAEYLNHPHLYATLRILINASYSKHTGYVTRYDEMNGKRVKRRFDLYSPMCISGIAGLEGVTLSRAFRIVMRRVEKDFPKANPNDYRLLRDKLYVLRIRRAFDVRGIYKKTDISNIVTARFEELFKPLFTMTAFMGTKEEWEILAQWCSEYQASFRIEALNVFEEEMILKSLSKTRYSMPDWKSLKEVANLVNIEYNRKLSSKHVSSVLHRLGLTKRKKVKGYTLVYAPQELIEESARRIGLHISDLPTPPSLPTPKLEDYPYAEQTEKRQPK